MINLLMFLCRYIFEKKEKGKIIFNFSESKHAFQVPDTSRFACKLEF